MTEFNDELAEKLAVNDKQLLRNWVAELEARLDSATSQERSMLSRRLRIIKDHIDNCDWAEVEDE